VAPLRPARRPHAEAELKGEVTRAEGGGTIRARLEAERLDLRPLLGRDEGAAGGGGEDAGALELDLRAKSVLLGPEPLDAVTLRAARRADGRVAQASLAASCPAAATPASS
jgi:hypothetical protein